MTIADSNGNGTGKGGADHVVRAASGVLT